MPNINDILTSKHLRAYDLKGTSPTVTIARVAQLPLGVTRAEKWVLFFAGKEKYLILNATLLRALSALAGEETDRWPGVAVTLYTTTTKNPQGQVVPVIRIKAPTARPSPVPAIFTDELEIDLQDAEAGR